MCIRYVLKNTKEEALFSKEILERIDDTIEVVASRHIGKK